MYSGVRRRAANPRSARPYSLTLHGVARPRASHPAPRDSLGWRHATPGFLVVPLVL